jgi:proteasome beta subunit
VGPEKGGRGWPALARHLAPGHKGSIKKDAQSRSEPIKALPAANRSIMDACMQPLEFGASGADDFPALLRRHGLLANQPSITGQIAHGVVATQSTTILAFKFAEAVLVAGDRRATAGTTVVYDRADKVLEIDRHSIMAIAGVPATAWEMARVLEHSFQFFRRTQLQEMSVDGKVRALSKLLRDNLGFALQGVGVVVPIFATFDAKVSPAARLYFYDAMGAQFEATDFAATGSGSPAVRGILYYENTWGIKPLQQLSEDEAVVVALRALDTAAEGDTATGGIDRHEKIFPVMKTVSARGITTLAEEKIAELFHASVA